MERPWEPGRDMAPGSQRLGSRVRLAGSRIAILITQRCADTGLGSGSGYARGQVREERRAHIVD